VLLATISPELNRQIQFLHQTSIKAESRKDLTAHSRGKPDRLLASEPAPCRRRNVWSPLVSSRVLTLLESGVRGLSSTHSPTRISSLSQTSANLESLRYAFFLGGRDLEMQAIGDIARSAGALVVDRGLAWGARASHYRDEIAMARADGYTPVLVELPWDVEQSADGVILVDHHGERAGLDRPSALRQVHALLGPSAPGWTRELALIEANDIGWIPAMQALGATLEEIWLIRAADRTAQGVTAAQESAAEQAIANLRWLADGRLAVVQCPHDRSAPITDRLHPALGGHAVGNLLLFGPKEVQFFGTGEIVLSLNAAHPGGWYGGALPERGYWGSDKIQDRHQLERQVLDWIGAI